MYKDMSVASLLAVLEDLRNKMYTVGSKYNVNYDMYTDDEQMPLSDAWTWNAVPDVLFEGQPINLNWVLDNPSKFESLPEEAQDSLKSLFKNGIVNLTELKEDLESFSKVYKQVETIFEESKLDHIGDFEVFLGLDSYYFESSKCW